MKEEAERLMTKVLDVDPELAPALGTLVLIKEEQREYEEARRLYSTALKLNPTLDFVHNGLERIRTRVA